MNESFPFDSMNKDVDMRRIKIFWKWIKVLILAPLAVFQSVILYAILETAWHESHHDFGRAFIDPRSLESLEFFYIYLHMSLIVGLSLFLTIAGLVRTLCPSKQPGRIIKHLRQYGLYMALVFAVLFAVFLVYFRIILHTASVLLNTSELYPVHEIILYHKIAMAASLSLFAGVISFVSGIIGIIEKKRNKTETS